MSKQTKRNPSAQNAINTGRTKRAHKPAEVNRALQMTAKQHEWADRVVAAVADVQQAGVRLLQVVLEARRLKVPEETVRDVVRKAYLDNGTNKETARKRGADAVAVLNSDKQAKSLPAGLQGAASAVRKLNKGITPGRAPRQPKGPKDSPTAQAADASGSPLAQIEAGIEALRAEATDPDVLEAIAELSDVASSLAAMLADHNAIEGESDAA